MTGRNAQPKVSPGDFEAVRDILASHIGPANAITKDRITELAGFRTADGRPDRRRTELIIELYRGDFPFMVVGSGTGMYLARDEEDLNREYARRLSYIKSIAAGWRDLRQQARKRGFYWHKGRFVRRQEELWS